MTEDRFKPDWPPAATETSPIFVTKNVTGSPGMKARKRGRPPLKRKAMTAKERQRRHRKKIAGLSKAEGGDELHETPAIAVHKLLKAEPLPGHIWDCCCGPGANLRVLRPAGHTVTASDIRNYDSFELVERILRKTGHEDIDGALRAYVPPNQDFVQDFLQKTMMPAGVEAMVMNPPFSKAAAFIRHALALGVPKVIALVRLAWLGSTGERSDLLEGGHLARIYTFRKRLPKMHRFGWPGPWTSADEEHCWLVWDIRHNGPPTLHWL